MLFESSILKDYFFLIYFGLLLQLNTQFPIWNGVGVEYAIWEVEGLIKKKKYCFSIEMSAPAEAIMAFP